MAELPAKTPDQSLSPPSSAIRATDVAMALNLLAYQEATSTVARLEEPMLRATWFRLYVLVMLAVMSAGCEIVGGIFKAGMWVGIIMVVLVVALIMWVLRRVGG